MIDMPNGSAASYSVLYTGYGSPGVASTVGFVQDGDIRVVTDPGMVRHRSLILDPLRDLGITPEDVTDVVFSHHHPDHTLNAALFPHARFHDHWAIYSGDQWHWRDIFSGHRTSESREVQRDGIHGPRDVPPRLPRQLWVGGHG